MTETPDGYPGQGSRADAFAIFAAVVAVVALAFSIPVFFLASSARDRAQRAEDRVAQAQVAAPTARSTTPTTPTTSATPSTTRPVANSASCLTTAGLGDNVRNKGTATATGTTIDIQAGDFFFKPTCLTQTAPGTVTLVVHNGGSALHNVSVADQGIDRDVAPGKTIKVQVRVTATPLRYFCKYHVGAGMVGALVPSA
jgi:plastocyanin